jgi:dihydropyrimidine dehydrogenase (NADP+)
MQMFKKMNLPQVLPPYIDNTADAYKSPIALFGCGPASISCATYLARLGYTKLTIYEKYDYIGGLRFLFRQKKIILQICFFSAAEIPQYRLPYEVVDFEIQLMRDLGVEICTNRALSQSKGMTLTKMHESGVKGVFIGIGKSWSTGDVLT